MNIGSGSVSLDATDGTSLTNAGTLTYPRDTRLTFSLVLNDSATPRDFNGGTIAARTMEVWYYNWSSKQSVFVMAIDVAASARNPVCLGLRTWSTSADVLAYIDNVKLLDAPVVVTEPFLPSDPPVVPPRPFVHPSVLNTQEELDRMKYRVNYEPGSAMVAGWNRLIASSLASLSYQHVPYSNVVVMGSGTTPSETQCRNDSQAARAAALRWVVTGDTRYRDKAMTILNDWAAVFVTLSPAAGTSVKQLWLEAAWYAPAWVAAADIIRYYNHGAAGWSATNIARFDAMLDYLYDQSAQAADRENNWGASAALSMISVGAYQENRGRFDAGIQTWRDRLVGINAVVGNNGFINEVCRDTTHPQYTLQVWMQAAEVAWKHGLDLYGMTLNGNTTPQFAINLENFSRLFLGQIPPPCDATFLTNYNYLGDQSVSGAYDIAHNHYVNRLALPGLTNYADMVVNHWRPGGFDGHFCAWSTLTHADLSTGLPVVTDLSLWQNSSNAPVRSLGDGDTLNLRTLGGNYSLAAQVTGTVSSVRFLTNSASAGTLDTAAPFLTALPPVGNYFLSAIPQRTFPAGTIPGDPFVRFLRVIDVPGMWTLLDVGALPIPALAQELDGTIMLTAAGTNLTGTGDQFGFLATDIAGDMQITAQVGAQSATNGRAGIMLREGTSAGGAVCLSVAGTFDDERPELPVSRAQPGRPGGFQCGGPAGCNLAAVDPVRRHRKCLLVRRWQSLGHERVGHGNARGKHPGRISGLQRQSRQRHRSVIPKRAGGAFGRKLCRMDDVAAHAAGDDQCAADRSRGGPGRRSPFKPIGILAGIESAADRPGANRTGCRPGAGANPPRAFHRAKERRRPWPRIRVLCQPCRLGAGDAVVHHHDRGSG